MSATARVEILGERNVVVDELAPVGVDGRHGRIAAIRRRLLLDHGRAECLEGRDHRGRIVLRQAVLRIVDDGPEHVVERRRRLVPRDLDRHPCRLEPAGGGFPREAFGQGMLTVTNVGVHLSHPLKICRPRMSIGIALQLPSVRPRAGRGV
jgi:hypothetical protein